MITAKEIYDVLETRRIELGISQAKASKKILGRKDSSFFQGLRRGSIPSVSRLDKACRALGLKFHLGENQITKAEKLSLTEDQAKTDKTIETHTQGLVRAVHAAGGDPIPADLRGALAYREAGETAAEPPGARPVDVVELACAAGGGAEVLSEDVIGRLWFRRDWLDEHGLNATQCAVLGVCGDSMQPTLADGAKILVNRASRQRRTNRIYVIRTDDGVIVKRLSKAGRNWRLVSDNADKAAWPNITLPARAEIIGQVVWTARTL